jgi:3-hydroxyisobutyrate dehydrogenase-like beta-hydroxyacid dehydrogenase
MQHKVGLIGIGLVGTALAERLVARGFNVVGYDIVPEKREQLERLGGHAACSPADVASRARRVVLSLLTSDIVRQVVAGEAGILEATLPPELVIDTTTGDPDETERIGELLAERGIGYLDATISGSSVQIGDGEGVFTVGGEPEHFAACEDILDALTDKAFHVGPVGSGCETKLVINLILGLNRAALAEGLAFAEALGLDLSRVLPLLAATPAYSRMMDTKGQKMVGGDFTTQARLSQHRKDIRLILDLAAKAGQELPLSEAHLAILDAAIAAGDGDLDNSAVIKELRRRRCCPEGG